MYTIQSIPFGFNSVYIRHVSALILVGVQVQDNGLVVAFYGHVKGFAMLSELGIDRTREDHTEVFRPNQVVKVRVMAVDLVERRMKVSLRTSTADIAAAASASGRSAKGHATSDATLLIGDVVEVEVTGKDESGVEVKACTTGAVGYIPLAHLADYESLATQVRSRSLFFATMPFVCPERGPGRRLRVTSVCGDSLGQRYR